jgi:cobalt-zinc-cadmium efflux system membrane fusion protein
MTGMKDTKELTRRRKPLWFIVPLFLCILLFQEGCGKKEPPKNEKPQASVESKDGANQEEKRPDVVTLSPEQLKISGIEVQKVALGAATTLLTATAVIELNADKTSKVSSRVTGRISRLMVSQGDKVKTGQALAFMDTAELGQIWSEYQKTKSRRELASRNLQREETLFEKKVAPEKDVHKARQELSEAEADLTFLKERLRLLGTDVSAVESQKGNGGNGHPLIPVASLVGGVVIEKSVTQGEFVSPEKALFTVADLSALWVLIDIYEKDLPRVTKDTPVKLSVAAFPDRQFHGKVAYLADLVDEKTRTVRARVVVDNKTGALKPGMFAAVQLELKNGTTGKTMSIPEEAVFLDGSERYVFLQEEDGKFTKRRVSVGPASGEKIEVKAGLKEGDVVVTKGVFTLKSELKKEALQPE